MPLTAAFCALLAALSLVALPAAGADDPLRIGRLADAEAVVIDGAGIGRLPRFLWSVPPATPVFVGDPDQVLSSAVPAGDGPLMGRTYFVDLSGRTAGSSPASTDAILAAYGRMAEVLLLDEGSTARIYLLTPKPVD